MLYCHLLIHPEIYIYMLDTYQRNDNRRSDKDAGINDAWRKTQKDFFNNIFTSHFIAKVRKGCSRFACERVLETEHKLHILTSTTYDRHVVSFLFSWCSTGGLGLTLLDAGFLYGILSASSMDPKLHRAFPRAPSVGCGFPYHIWSLAVWNSTGNCFLDSNSTELNNNSTPTRSPTGSLKSNV